MLYKYDVCLGLYLYLYLHLYPYLYLYLYLHLYLYRGQVFAQLLRSPSGEPDVRCNTRPLLTNPMLCYVNWRSQNQQNAAKTAHGMRAIYVA